MVGDISDTRKPLKSKKNLPPVSVVRVARIDNMGDLWFEPLEWDQPMPRILYQHQKKDVAVKIGDKVLVRLSSSDHEDIDFKAHIIRRLGYEPQAVIGIYRVGDKGGSLTPVDRKNRYTYKIASADSNGAEDGELVEAIPLEGHNRRNMALISLRVITRIGNPSSPKAISLIAIHQHNIPDHFPDNVIKEGQLNKKVDLNRRRDLRHLPLLTIDPSDARDHDDAICALLDDDPNNDGGYRVWVAIADVAYYVRPDTALDREACDRGNSSYFPDRVVPMLPEYLSNDLCSLHENVDRPCLAVEMIFNSSGEKIRHHFVRGYMKSIASISYKQAQEAFEGRYDEQTRALSSSLSILYGAYKNILKNEHKRQSLNLDLPERKIVLSKKGKVTSIDFRQRFDSHKLIEQFMVLANVCAAETLEYHQQPLLYRVHEEPPKLKLDSLYAVVKASHLHLPKGQVLQTAHLNRLLAHASKTEFSELINMTVLRSMTRAYYACMNYGHFGLNLRRYVHFTSPIRRYADLIVHRGLIKALKLGDDGLSDSQRDSLPQIAEWISNTERRSMVAERDTIDRYVAAYLSDRIDAEFEGRVSGISKFGLFVKLTQTGADGIIPLRSLGYEYWRYDKVTTTLRGKDSGRIIGLGMPCVVRLKEATPVSGGLTFELLELEGKSMPKARKKKRTPKRRKLGDGLKSPPHKKRH